MKQNPGRRMTRHQFGALLNQGWGKSATSANATSGFRATGVFPGNPGAIPEYAFTTQSTSVSEILDPEPSTSGTQEPSVDKPTPTRILNQISPLPRKLYEVRKRAEQVSILLTSEDHIEKRKTKEKEKADKENRPKRPMIKQQENKTEKCKEKTITKRKAIRRISVVAKKFQ